MKPDNNVNYMNNSNSYNNLINNLKLKLNNSMNIKNKKNNLGFYNKLFNNNFKYNNDNNINNNIFNKILHKNFKINPQTTKNHNNILNNRYFDLKQLNFINDMKLSSNKLINNYSNLNNHNSKNFTIYNNITDRAN